MKRMVLPQNVEKVFSGKMPNGFINNVNGWFFTKREVKQAAKKGKLLTLDVDMSGKGICSLKCPHCFRRSNEFLKMKVRDFVSYDELLVRIDEARKLGLKSVKLIGPGEPLEDPNFIKLLIALRKRNITPIVFTKSYILGDDSLCQKLHGMDGKTMIKLLKELDVSILFGVTSFNSEYEDGVVGRIGFHKAREEAIRRLCEAGFNEFVPGQATRLAMVFNPITPYNINEIYDAYVWARERNIHPISSPTMVAGKGLDTISSILPDKDKLIDLYVKINLWAIEHEVYTLSDIKKYGVASYVGGHWCNQISVGMFMRGDGIVLRCPGDDITIQGDINEQSLTQIWNNSENKRKYAGQFNNGCPPKDGQNSTGARSFPEGFFVEVKRRILDYFKR
ncbi:MAG: radical SAM protein [Candidatus Micrarchaeia archaeon]